MFKGIGQYAKDFAFSISMNPQIPLKNTLMSQTLLKQRKAKYKEAKKLGYDCALTGRRLD